MHFDRLPRSNKQCFCLLFLIFLALWLLTLESQMSPWRETNLRLGNRLRLLPDNSLQASMPTVFLYCLPADFNENCNLKFSLTLTDFIKTCTNILVVFHTSRIPPIIPLLPVLPTLPSTTKIITQHIGVERWSKLYPTLYNLIQTNERSESSDRRSRVTECRRHENTYKN